VRHKADAHVCIYVMNVHAYTTSWRREIALMYARVLRVNVKMYGSVYVRMQLHTHKFMRTRKIIFNHSYMIQIHTFTHKHTHTHLLIAFV
jgi:hypothetical protein